MMRRNDRMNRINRNSRVRDNRPSVEHLYMSEVLVEKETATGTF
jgi:hypothetical protein